MVVTILSLPFCGSFSESDDVHPVSVTITAIIKAISFFMCLRSFLLITAACAVYNSLFAVYTKSVVSFYMLLYIVEYITFQVDKLSAFTALQMKVIVAVAVLGCVAVYNGFAIVSVHTLEHTVINKLCYQTVHCAFSDVVRCAYAVGYFSYRKCPVAVASQKFHQQAVLFRIVIGFCIHAITF